MEVGTSPAGLAALIGITPGLQYKDLVAAHYYEEKDAYKVTSVKATCEDPAYTLYKCKYADEIAGHDATMYKKVITAPAKGHKWSTWEVQYEVGAGDNEYGVWVRTCSVCKKTDNYISKLPPPELCKEHVPVIDEENSVPATCEAKGYNVYVCSVCGLELEDLNEEVAALGHKGTLVKAIKAATCTEAGTGEYYCSVCKTGYEDTIPALGHDWDEGKVTTEPTTEKAGVKTYTCKVCKATKTEEIKKLDKPAEYKLADVKFEGTVLSGKIVHTEGTLEAKKLSVRVTFFIAGNTYMTTSAVIYEDGTFEAEGAGSIEHVTLAAYATDKVVNPDGLKDVDFFGSKEFDVK